MDANIPNSLPRGGSAVRKVASQPAWVTSPAACHQRPGQQWRTVLGGVGRSQAKNGCEAMAGADATLQSRLRHPARWGPSIADVRAERTLCSSQVEYHRVPSKRMFQISSRSQRVECSKIPRDVCEASSRGQGGHRDELTNTHSTRGPRWSAAERQGTLQPMRFVSLRY